MRKLQIFVLFLLLPVACFAQDIAGKWAGTLTQQGASFAVEINIASFNNGVLNGISRYNGGGGLFAEMRFTGNVSGKDVSISEYEVAMIPDSLICALKVLSGTLRTDTANGEQVISGKWVSTKTYQNKKYINTPLAEGEFKISRKVNIANITKAKDKTRPIDGWYEKTSIKQNKMVTLPELREADVVFEHRVWREIDLREKMNQVMAAPKSRLIDILMDAINRGELTAYDPSVSTTDDPDGDQFSTPLTAAKARTMLADSSVVNSFDKNGEKIGSKMVAGEFNPDSILRFRLKEDFIFDKQRSVAEYRIIGIAPLIRKKLGNIQTDYQPAFWLYFPEVRKVLVKKPVVNHHNDVTGLSYDDMFMKRLFNGYIVKESNDKDTRIKDQFKGFDRLYESERINKALLDWELNLWQY